MFLAHKVIMKIITIRAKAENKSLRIDNCEFNFWIYVHVVQTSNLLNFPLTLKYPKICIYWVLLDFLIHNFLKIKHIKAKICTFKRKMYGYAMYVSWLKVF